MKETKKRDKFSPLTVTMLVFLAAYCVALFFMLGWGLAQSFKYEYIFTTDTTSFPNKDTFTLDNYIAVFAAMNTNWNMQAGGSANFLGLTINTLMYSIGGALLNVIVTAFVAYLVARYNYFYSKILYMIVIVVMVVPIVGAQASEIQVLRYLRLYDTRWAFLVLKASFVGGVYFLVLHAAFKNIPSTYSEAAMIDGAGNWCIMLRICMPLVLNVCTTIFLITFIQYWNDYQLPLVYMPSYPTFSYFIFLLKASSAPIPLPSGEKINASVETLQLSSAFVLMAPIFTIFILSHKRLMGNLSVGDIKG